MNRRELLKMAAMGIASLAVPRFCMASGATAGSGMRPNFVFILADDLGYMDIGANNPKSFYETPNIDRLAAQGMRFTDGYASCSVCSPTRASIMTGKYPARVGITNFLQGDGKHLAREEVTVAEALKQGGYATGFFGKWHLGGEGFYPENQGFDVNIGGSHWGQPASYFSPYRNPRMTDGPAGEYLTDRLTDEAIKFIEANKDKPFLVYLSHYAVHNPQQAKAGLIEKYKAKAASLPRASGPEFAPEGERQVRQIQNQPVYAAMIQSVDEGVERIAQRLRELGIDQNTIVVFTSDNGGLSTSEGSPTSNVPLRAGKGWPYEGGVREPLIIKAPGIAKAGTLCRTPVTSTDFYPTMLELAGLPPRPQQHVDGVSIEALLKGQDMPRRPLFWHYPHHSNQGGAPCGTVRDGDWKLIEWYGDGNLELYNLKDDSGETRNLAWANPAKLKELRDKLAAWRKEVNAVMPAVTKGEGGRHKTTKQGTEA